MATIVQLSDLHFDWVHWELIDPLLTTVWNLQPDLVVVSGDFTQAATADEWRNAQNFWHRLPAPKLAVPGNHDASFFNPLRRAVQGLSQYARYITNDFTPFWEGDGVVVQGLNTARRSLLRGGRISRQQVDLLEQRMHERAPEAVRILVTHHPFDLPPTYADKWIVGQARKLMRRVLHSVDVMLAGHYHTTGIGSTSARYKAFGESAVFVQAGTALSTRTRGEVNAFNVLRVSNPRVAVEHWSWSASAAAYGPVAVNRFVRQGIGGWKHDCARDGEEPQPCAEPTSAAVRTVE